jgi:hypothetical protein
VACSAAGCVNADTAGDKPRAEHDVKSGRLTRVEYDANGNGRNDAVSIMDGARIRWIELDLDENGKVERWDFYGADNTLEKVGFSRQNDGVLDAHAFYGGDGALARMVVSTRRDGRFDRVEYYEIGVLVRSEEDVDADGRPDKWETYRRLPGVKPGEPAYAITSAAFDDLGRGIPHRRFTYDERGRIARVELDPDGDGQFTTE